MNVDLFWDIAWKVGLPFILVMIALLSGRAGIWVWGRELDEIKEQRNYYRDIVYGLKGKN